MRGHAGGNKKTPHTTCTAFCLWSFTTRKTSRQRQPTFRGGLRVVGADQCSCPTTCIGGDNATAAGQNIHCNWGGGCRVMESITCSGMGPRRVWTSFNRGQTYGDGGAGRKKFFRNRQHAEKILPNGWRSIGMRSLSEYCRFRSNSAADPGIAAFILQCLVAHSPLRPHDSPMCCTHRRLVPIPT